MSSTHSPVPLVVVVVVVAAFVVSVAVNGQQSAG